MSTVPDGAPAVKTSLRPNGTRRILRPEHASCDRRIKRGRKADRICSVRATHYDSTSEQNLCGLHARHTPAARLGRGPSWYEARCTNHHDRAAVAIGSDDVPRCFGCSFDYELTAAPEPVIDAAYFANLRAGVFA